MDSDACYFFLRHRRRRMAGPKPAGLRSQACSLDGSATKGGRCGLQARSLGCLLLFLMILPAASRKYFCASETKFLFNINRWIQQWLNGFNSVMAAYYGGDSVEF
ncbi:hypothetical protein ElyMa_000127100 [Elysia marginata]|uniref:Uncharacterized protein n=1 Tax=Elysia marginata TaxID=1093978 RepID=A0AAV4EMG8_9GAST|nr:hypothetical protein ElyMa_000127100 [Elysia marginata]